MLTNYLNYLNFINNKLNKFFISQKPYIFCKKGCSKCCKNAKYFYSKIEFEYLSAGLKLLNSEEKQIIINNINNLKQEKKAGSNKNFVYECPLLINGSCSVYNYRGIICRTFGLMTAYNDGSIKIPFCAYNNLNYSNVIDTENEKISVEKFKKLNIKEEPLAFNISYEYLTDSDFEKLFNFQFGEKKPLFNWLIDYSKRKSAVSCDTRLCI